MEILTNQRQAFFETVRCGSFSKAAQKLHITQSALSQRIMNLESGLGTTLLVRASSGLRLTAAGEKLLRYCQIQGSLEQELFDNLHDPEPKGFGGVLRIGGLSSVMWSVIIPALNELVINNPKIQIQMITRELRELPELLRTGEIDFAVTEQDLKRQDMESHLLGRECNVLVESKLCRYPERYIDHDPEDQTTNRFFQLQGKRKLKLDRIFMDDINGLIAGVTNGWGRAIIPKQILAQHKHLQIVEGYKPLELPVYLHYYSQPFYSNLHSRVVKVLSESAKRLLQG